MLWIWRFCIGYLTIKINRANGEQILNRAAASGIKIWNLHYKNGYIYGNISAKNFLKLYNARRGIKCEIKIAKKHGVIFWIKNYNKRIGFIIGVIAFFSILFYLTNFIWIINVEGNNIIPSSKIINSCKNIGIYEGVHKNKINNKYAAQRLQLIQDGIAWCSFNVEGCILTVNLSETEPLDNENRQTPSNLKSLIEGKIKKIDVTSGNVLVKVNDVVSKGDLLVSGISENLTGNVFIHSSGEIIAETKRVFSAQGNFEQKCNDETGKIIKRYSIEIFGKKIPLYIGKINQSHKYECNSNYIKLFKKKTPLKIACEEYKITNEITKKYDTQTLEEILYNDIKKQIDNFNFMSIKELERELTPTATGVLLNITYICEENIAIQDEILLGKVN